MMDSISVVQVGGAFLPWHGSCPPYFARAGLGLVSWPFSRMALVPFPPMLVRLQEKLRTVTTLIAHATDVLQREAPPVRALPSAWHSPR